MSIQFDCVVWSLDKTKTYAKVWYPLNEMLSSVPRAYRQSEDNLTLYDAKSGLPLITYEDNSFKVLNDFTDWTLYIHLNGQTGLVELTDGINIGIGGIVSKTEKHHCMKIFGKATVHFQDSIWSQADIVTKDVTYIGYEDDIFTDDSFILAHSLRKE